MATTKRKSVLIDGKTGKVESPEALGCAVAQSTGKLLLRCEPLHLLWNAGDDEAKKTMRLAFIRGHMRFDPMSINDKTVEIPVATVDNIIGMTRTERTTAQHQMFERARLAFKYNVERPVKVNTDAKKSKLDKLRNYCNLIAKLEFAEEKAVEELRAAFKRQAQI